jgi:trk system potassium uptake protein TrkH
MCAAAGLAAILALGRLFGAALLVGALPAVATVAVSAARLVEGSSVGGNVFNHHARLLVMTFFALCLVGTALLSLPACSADGHRVPLVDAAFTAVSAVCVTGLIVRDTPGDFSHLGQVIILLLIQVGGLGIMTFATATIGLLGRRMSLSRSASPPRS